MLHGFERKGFYRVLACLRVGCVFGKSHVSMFFETLSKIKSISESRKHGPHATLAAQSQVDVY